MVCLTVLFSKQSRNFNCPTFQIFIASVRGGGGGGEGNLSISYLEQSCLSHQRVLSKTARFMKRKIFMESSHSRDVKTNYADLECKTPLSAKWVVIAISDFFTTEPERPL